MDQTVLKTIGTVLGIMLAVPVIYAIIQFTRFLSEIRHLAADTAKKLDESISELKDIVSAHGTEIVALGRAVAVLEAERKWDGKERREAERRDAERTNHAG